MNQFDVNTVTLNNKILVEASAGTGKTYSIAVLILRLILEKNVNISRMLIVTFTNDAVFELQERIRKYLYNAQRYIKDGIIEDGFEHIATMIDHLPFSIAEKKDRISLSTLLLDESHIMTIHGFAQATLTDYAFETMQDFSTELVTSADDIVADIINDFWRNEVITLNPFLIKSLGNLGTLEPLLYGYARKYLSEVPYLPNADRDIDFRSTLHQIVDDDTKGDIPINELLFGILEQDYLPLIHRRINDAQLLTFDKMIKNLHDAVVLNRESNQGLIQLMRDQYDAVFIDEFQDTDRIQFEIFRTLFIDDAYKCPIFLIGDPKQSIYGFRGADVDSYLAAKSLISSDHIYSMNTNYRTASELIDEVNHFFMNGVDNAFGYDDDSIAYHEVQAIKSQKLSLKSPYLEFYEYSNVDDAKKNLAMYLSHQLANTNITIDNRPLKPSDFAILVTSKSDGRKIQDLLISYDIPSVMIDDSTVSETDEFNGIKLLMEAMLTPNFSTIRKACHLSFLSIDLDKLDLMTEVEKILLINNFIEYGNIMKNDGIYAAYEKLLNEYNLNWSLSKTTSGLRILSNIRQIIEILNEVQINDRKSPYDILTMMKQKDFDDGNDKYTLRMESDEEAVQIVTVHRSKGLEYNWVISFGLGKAIQKNGKTPFYSLKIAGVNHFLDREKLDGSLYKEWMHQEEREKLRLLYVAITRAKYKCDIFYTSRHFGRSALKRFSSNINKLKISSQDFGNGVTYLGESENTIIPQAIPHFYSADSAWRKYSFSALAHHQSYPQSLLHEMINDRLDHFTYRLMPKGKLLGEALHLLLEKIDFSDDFIAFESLTYANKRWIRRFYQDIQNAEDDILDDITAFLFHIKNTDIKTDSGDINLRNLSQRNSLSEVPFYFQVDGNKDDINALLLQYGVPLSWRSPTAFIGVMNGFIDLLWEHGGKYYILDWKSNYLGDHDDAYAPAAVADAMLINDYHLQYTIYTIASYQFLNHKIKDFDYDQHFGGVIYLFVRGMRVGSDHGIYYHKPPKELIVSLVKSMKH